MLRFRSLKIANFLLNYMTFNWNHPIYFALNLLRTKILNLKHAADATLYVETRPKIAGSSGVRSSGAEGAEHH